MGGKRSGEFAGAGFGEVVAIEALTEQGLDDGLTTDVEFPSGSVQLAQHGGGEVHIHVLDRRHHLAGVGEKGGNVFSAVGETGNGLG